MLKKMISALFLTFIMLVGAAAAGSIYPVSRTDIDGVTRYGYLDEDGLTVLPFVYSRAGAFADCGLAAVEDNQWQTAVIDRTGKLVIPYTESPVSVDFSDDMVAYRYSDHSVYYTLAGERVGSYAGAEGFFSDGLLLCKSESTGLYSFVRKDGTTAFGGFREAGGFSNGRALVRTAAGEYNAIDTSGKTLYSFGNMGEPVYLTIFGEDTIVLTDGSLQALYSLSAGEYLTDFVYSSVSEFRDGAAMVCEMNRWGLISTDGKLLTKPTYYYLSYMGEELYAARSEDGSISAVDAYGNIAYRTPSYVGGFDELSYGLSWHGNADGTLIFFKKNGGYFASLKNAENPTILSENVVRVTQDGVLKYVNLSTGKMLFTQQTSFELGRGITASTVHYERFLGYQSDGTEYGWDIRYPEISGLSDTDVQKKINASIRKFFLEGPSATAEYDALEGSYGASVEGSVLVVWANCVSGRGSGASVWNNSLAFDLRTGQQYTIDDLFSGSYVETVKSLLPDTYAFYLYSFPRMSADGVTYYYNEYETETRRAYTEQYLLTFEQLGDAVNKQGACYMALQTPFTRENLTVAGFSDVSRTHWAAAYIEQVQQAGLMQGDTGGTFRPDDKLTGAELCVTIVRSENLPQELGSSAEGAWYSPAVQAMEDTGLLDDTALDFTKLITREDAMQVFANLLVRRGNTLPGAKEAESILSPFRDGASVSAGRRSAAALCIKAGMIEGSNGYLRPQGYFSRAEFAKLLTLI